MKNESHKMRSLLAIGVIVVTQIFAVTVLASGEAMSVSTTKAISVSESEAISVSTTKAISVSESEALSVSTTKALSVASSETVKVARIEAFGRAQRAAAEGQYDEVVVILSQAIDKGALEASDLAIAYSNRGIAQSLLKRYGLAIQDLRSAIEIDPGHLLTLNHLGILAENIERDYVTASAWYARAAALGYPASQVNLGNLYRHGSGVTQDLKRAVALYEAAFDSGYDVAFVALGEMYLEGIGVERDAKRGLALLRQGVDSGVVTGNHMIGRAYEKGWGLRRSYELAFTHYQLAALQGHAPSQGALGYLFRRGFGTAQDFGEAAGWYRLAAEQGDIEAINRFAWLMATCPIKTVCNGEVAVQFAQLAVDASPTPSHLDSLAAGYARLGEFDKAIIVIDRVHEMALSDDERKKYSGRVDRYTNGIPFQL